MRFICVKLSLISFIWARTQSFLSLMVYYYYYYMLIVTAACVYSFSVWQWSTCRAADDIGLIMLYVNNQLYASTQRAYTVFRHWHDRRVRVYAARPKWPKVIICGCDWVRDLFAKWLFWVGILPKWYMFISNVD